MQGDSDDNAALWAIDLKWFEQRSHELLRQHDPDSPDSGDFNAYQTYINRNLLRADNPYIIVSAKPIRLNQRMMTQQGQLLCGLRHNVAFSTSLLGMLVRPTVVERQVVSKVVVRRDRRIDFLGQLRRMNIHDASLFPGLDGFARSLAVNLEISVAHQIEERKQSMIENVKDYRRKQGQTQSGSRPDK